MDKSEPIEEFEGFRIEINRIRDTRFNNNDFNGGFGWAFQVFAPHANAVTFSVVVKSLIGKREDVNVQKARELGRGIVHQRIREHQFNEMGSYGYRWEPNAMPVTEVDCQMIDSHRFDVADG